MTGSPQLQGHVTRASTWRVRSISVGACVAALVGALVVAPSATAATRNTVPAVAPASPGPLPASGACSSTAPGTVTCELWAAEGTVTLPGPGGPTAVPIWGYRTLLGAPQLPGPVIIVTEGDVVTVTLHNDLPAVAGATSLAFPAQSLAPDPVGVALGGTTSYAFTADAPGTFLYEAGLTDNGPRQVAMGLVGALIVRPAGNPDQAYDAPASAFDDEALVVLSEIDPAFNADPLGFDLSRFRPTYRLVNGEAYPDTDPIVTDAGRRVLLRYVNAGLDNHSMGLLGRHQSVVGSHGRRQVHPYSVVAETIASGTTLDTIVKIPATVAPDTRYALYEPADRLDNAGARSGVAVSFGGMLTFLQVDTGGVGGDAQGPATGGAQVTPSLSDGTGPVQLVASTDDTLTGGSNITEAKWSVGPTAAPPGTGTLMSASDGTFDEPAEAVEATVATGALADGTHRLWMRARDAAGNWGPAASTSLVVDRVGSATTGLAASPNPTDGSVNVTISATGDDSASGGSDVTEARYFLDSASCGGPATPLSLGGPPAATVGLSGGIAAPVPGGTHDVSAQSRDAAGNWGPCAAAAVPLSVDQSPPTVDAVVATDNPTNAASVVLTAAASDVASGSSPITAAEYWVDAGTHQAMGAADSAFDTPSEALSAVVDVSALPLGPHVLSVRARDAAGHWSGAGATTLMVTPFFADGFESGDFGAWLTGPGTTDGPHGPVAVVGPPAMAGAMQLRAVITGNTPGYVQDNLPENLTAYHARFSFNPNGTTTARRHHDILTGRNSANTVIFRVQFRKDGSRYQVRGVVRRGNREQTTSWFTITNNAANTVEIGWSSGSRVSFRLYVGGALKQTLINLNTSAYLLDTMRLGPSANLSSGQSGTEYFDAFVSTRTTAVIGL